MKNSTEKSNLCSGRSASPKKLPIRVHSRPFAGPSGHFSTQPSLLSSASLCVLMLNPAFVTFEKVTSRFLLPFFHAFFRAKTPQNAICDVVTFLGRVSHQPFLIFLIILLILLSGLPCALFPRFPSLGVGRSMLDVRCSNSCISDTLRTLSDTFLTP